MAVYILLVIFGQRKTKLFADRVRLMFLKKLIYLANTINLIFPISFHCETSAQVKRKRWSSWICHHSMKLQNKQQYSSTFKGIRQLIISGPNWKGSPLRVDRDITGIVWRIAIILLMWWTLLVDDVYILFVIRGHRHVQIHRQGKIYTNFGRKHIHSPTLI